MTIVCEHSTDLPQPPAEVFALLDDFSRLPAWHAHCEGLAKQGHGPNETGDKLRYAHLEGGKHHLMDGVIVMHDAPHRLTCRYFDKAMQIVVDYRLESLPNPGGPDGTRLIHRLEITPQTFMAKLKAPMIRAKADDQMRQALDRLGKLLSRQMVA